MNLYDKASLILTPNGFKASKLYSLKPTNGTGDFAFSRNGTATRVNSSGLIESVAINVPRLNYPSGGGCPSILLEPARTNLFFNSAWVNSGGYPTDWTFAGTGMATPNGLDPKYASSLGVTKYLFTATAQQPVLFRSLSVVSGNTYVFSIEIVSYTGTLNYGDVLFANGAFFSSTSFKMNGTTVSSAQNVNQTGTLELTLVCNASGTSTVRVGAGALYVNKTCTIELSSPQVEIGSYKTSFMISPVGSTFTRTPDSFSKTGISSLIGQTEGTIFFDYIAGAAVADDLISFNIVTTNTVALTQFSSGAIRIVIYYGSTTLSILSSVTVVAGSRYKIALRYKSGDTKIYINGSSAGSSVTAFAFTGSLSEINVNKATAFFAGIQTNQVKAIAIYPTGLSDSELAALTTL